MLVNDFELCVVGLSFCFQGFHHQTNDSHTTLDALTFNFLEPQNILLIFFRFAASYLLLFSFCFLSQQYTVLKINSSFSERVSESKCQFESSSCFFLQKFSHHNITPSLVYLFVCVFLCVCMYACVRACKFDKYRVLDSVDGMLKNMRRQQPVLQRFYFEICHGT